jgi:hypothetical protein
MNVDVQTERVVRPEWRRMIDAWVERCRRQHSAVVGLDVTLLGQIPSAGKSRSARSVRRHLAGPDPGGRWHTVSLTEAATRGRKTPERDWAWSAGKNVG